MATSVLPALIDALYAALSAALPGVDVYDGFGVSDSPGDYLMVGVDDPENEDVEMARVNQSQVAFGSTHPRHESGEVHLYAMSWNGDGDYKAARDAAHAIVAAAENALRPNAAPDVLGVAGLMSLSLASGSPKYPSFDGGAKVAIPFDIAFLAQI